MKLHSPPWTARKITFLGGTDVSSFFVFFCTISKALEHHMELIKGFFEKKIVISNVFCKQINNQNNGVPWLLSFLRWPCVKIFSYVYLAVLSRIISSLCHTQSNEWIMGQLNIWIYLRENNIPLLNCISIYIRISSSHNRFIV